MLMFIVRFPLILTFIVLLLLAQNAYASVQEVSENIDKLLQSTSPRFFNGVILIKQDGKTIYTKEQGYADFDNREPISINNTFRVMSNSKQITAALVLREVEKGKLDLHAPIQNVLLDLKQEWAKTVTTHQLLNMSSGIVALDKALLFEPGKGYRYSNPGYGLLGRIIEKLNNQSFAQVANALFAELGMKHTESYDLESTQSKLINSYWLKDGKTQAVDFSESSFTQASWRDFLPAGGIVSTAFDLSLWDEKLHNGKILSPESYKLMVTSSNNGPHAAFGGDVLGYGYGLRLHDQHPVKHLGHGGRGLGFVSLKLYIPETKVNVIVWENIYSRDENWMGGDVVYHFEDEIRKIVINSSLGKP